MRGRRRPVLLDSLPQGWVSAADQGGRAVLHNGNEFVRSLAVIKGDNNQALGRGRQIHRDPPDGVRGQQAATFALSQTFGSEKGSGSLH